MRHISGKLHSCARTQRDQILEIAHDPSQPSESGYGMDEYLKLCIASRRPSTGSALGGGWEAVYREAGLSVLDRPLFSQMPDPVSAHRPHELLLIYSDIQYTTIGFSMISWPGSQRSGLTLQFIPVSRRVETPNTNIAMYSRVAGSWFRAVTALLYEIIRIYRPTTVFALIRASSKAPVPFEHTKVLSLEMDRSGDAFKTDESLDFGRGARLRVTRTFDYLRMQMLETSGCRL